MGKRTDRKIELEAINLYKTGLSAIKIGKKFGISPCCVCCILKRYAVKMRNGSDRCKKLSADSSFFEKIDTEDKAYFLGLLYSDGYIVNRDGVPIGFGLILCGDDELELLEKFKKSLKFTGNIRLKKKLKKRFKQPYRIDITNKKMVKDLIELGCVPNKSVILEFPTDKQVPERLMNHFIRGYFDGDGCVSFKKDKTLLIGLLSSKFFAKGFKNFIKGKLNINIGLYDYKNRPNNTDIKTSGINAIKFLDWIYKDSTVFLKRKRKKYKEYLKYLTFRLKNKIGFACLDQRDVKELCQYFKYEYTDDYQYALPRRIRDKICNDYLNNNFSVRKISRKYKISTNMTTRILIKKYIYKNLNSKFSRETLNIHKNLSLLKE